LKKIKIYTAIYYHFEIDCLLSDMIYFQLLISRQSSTIRRNLSAELIRTVELSGALVDLAVVVVVVVVVNDGYFFNKSCCFIEPRRTNTGVLDIGFFVVTGGTFRSIDKRGLVVVDESAAKARNGPFERAFCVVTTSIDDRGLRIELVVELAEDRRLLSCVDVCLC
jgi:hypothetical protein